MTNKFIHCYRDEINLLVEKPIRTNDNTNKQSRQYPNKGPLNSNTTSNNNNTNNRARSRWLTPTGEAFFTGTGVSSSSASSSSKMMYTQPPIATNDQGKGQIKIENQGDQVSSSSSLVLNSSSSSSLINKKQQSNQSTIIKIER